MLLLERLGAGLQKDGRKVLLAVKAMGGESSDAWRSVLDNLIGRGALPSPTFRIADPQPDDACQRPHSWCKIPPAAAGGPYRCTVPLHDKDVFDTHVLACAAPASPKRAVTGADRGTMEPRKPLPSARIPGGIPVFRGPSLPLGAIQR